MSRTRLIILTAAYAEYASGEATLCERLKLPIGFFWIGLNKHENNQNSQWRLK